MQSVLINSVFNSPSQNKVCLSFLLDVAVQTTGIIIVKFQVQLEIFLPEFLVIKMSWLTILVRL